MAINIYSDNDLKSRLDVIDPLTRIFILNIPTHFNEESLKRGFERHGNIEVYAFQNCENDNGWAFVGYSSRSSVKRLMKHMYRKSKKNQK